MKEQQKQDNKEVQLPDWFKRDVEKEPVEDVEESFGPFPNLVWQVLGEFTQTEKQPESSSTKKKWWHWGSSKEEEPKPKKPDAPTYMACFPTKEDCITWSLGGSSLWYWPGVTQPFQIPIKEVIQDAIAKNKHGVLLLDGEGKTLATWKLRPE